MIRCDTKFATTQWSLGMPRDVIFMLDIGEKFFTEFVSTEDQTRIFLVEGQYVTTEPTRPNFAD